jgi:hypothetical protein
MMARPVLLAFIIVLMMAMFKISMADTYVLNMTLLSNKTASAWPFSLDAPYRFAIANNFSYITSQTDDGLSIYNITNPRSMTGYVNYTDTAPPDSMDGAYGVEYYCYNASLCVVFSTSNADDGIIILNVTNKIPTVLWSTNNSGTAYSLDGVIPIKLFNYSGSLLLMAGAGTASILTVLNVTNPRAVTNVSSYYDAAGNCSIEGVRRLSLDYVNNVMYTAGTTDDYICAYNLSTIGAGNITCMNCYYDASPPNSVDGVEGMYFDQESNLLVTGSYVDSEFVIFNMSNLPVFTVAARIYNITPASVLNSTWLAEMSKIVTYDGTRYLFASTRGNDTVGYRGHINVYNITLPTAPIWLKGYNTSSGVCVNHLIRDINIEDNILYYVSVNDDCFYAVQAFDKFEEEEPPATTCTCPGAGTWAWDFADNCNITANCLGIDTIYVKNANAGTWNISARIEALTWILNGTVGQWIAGIAGGYLKDV